MTGCTSSIEEFYDSKLSLDQPVDWWHQLQGGPIANERPPPPGITDPYPNLASVPAKPVPTDPATRAGLTAQLAAQRDRARLLAAQDPVTFPTLGAAAPVTRAPVTSPTPAPAAPAASDSEPSTMTLEAASATPPAARPAWQQRRPPTQPPLPPSATRPLRPARS